MCIEYFSYLGNILNSWIQTFVLLNTRKINGQIAGHNLQTLTIGLADRTVVRSDWFYYWESLS